MLIPVETIEEELFLFYIVLFMTFLRQLLSNYFRFKMASLTIQRTCQDVVCDVMKNVMNIVGAECD